MNSRERILKALNHEEPDLIPFDLAGTTWTGISNTAYQNLLKHLGQSNENPVYYVQYGHARIASIFRKAESEGTTLDGGDVSLLTHPSELELIRQMLRLREVVAHIAVTLAPHHLTYYAQDLASAFHAFYRDCRVVMPENPALSAARLKLVKAAKITLANTLHLMGMTAPERM